MFATKGASGVRFKSVSRTVEATDWREINAWELVPFDLIRWTRTTKSSWIEVQWYFRKILEC